MATPLGSPSRLICFIRTGTSAGFSDVTAIAPDGLDSLTQASTVTFRFPLAVRRTGGETRHEDSSKSATSEQGHAFMDGIDLPVVVAFTIACATGSGPVRPVTSGPTRGPAPGLL